MNFLMEKNKASYVTDFSLHRHRVTGENYYRSRVYFSQVSLIEPLCKISNTMQKLKNPYILNLKEFSISTTQKANTIYRFDCYFEYENFSLAEEIKNRKEKDIKFSGEELVHLLYQMISANVELQKNSLPHGSVCIDAIQFDQKTGRFRLAYPQIKNILLKLIKAKEIGSQEFNSSANDKSCSKQDVWRLGIVILQCGLEEFIPLYEEIGKSELFTYLNRFKNLYSSYELLCSSLSLMLISEPEKRPSFILLSKSLPSYRTIIEFLEKTKKIKIKGIEEKLVESKEPRSCSRNSLKNGSNCNSGEKNKCKDSQKQERKTEKVEKFYKIPKIVRSSSVFFTNVNKTLLEMTPLQKSPRNFSPVPNKLYKNDYKYYSQYKNKQKMLSRNISFGPIQEQDIVLFDNSPSNKKKYSREKSFENFFRIKHKKTKSSQNYRFDNLFDLYK